MRPSQRVHSRHTVLELPSSLCGLKHTCGGEGREGRAGRAVRNGRARAQTDPASAGSDMHSTQRAIDAGARFNHTEELLVGFRGVAVLTD